MHDLFADSDVALRSLSTADRRRRRARLVWAAVSAVAGAGFGVVGWEVLLDAGRASAGSRPWGYGAAALMLVAALAELVRRWWGPVPAAAAIATRLERLFPQARGLAVHALVGPGAGLLGARSAQARGWLARRGSRLEAALAARDGSAAARARCAAAVCVALLAVVAAARPDAAQRAAHALVTPSALLRSGEAAWRVEPGDARVAYGGSVLGRVRFEGPPSPAPIVLEWSTPDGVWRAETLDPTPAAQWRWDGLTSPRDYRLRSRASASALYRIEVGAPLAVEAAQLRKVGGDWEAITGQPVAIGERLEVRGRASGELTEAALVPDRGEDRIALVTDGPGFRGVIRPAAGAWRITLRALDGRSLTAAAFHAVRPGEASVLLLRPSQDPVRLAATGAWLEVRAISPEGIRGIGWETADGRHGSLGDPRGARDTALLGIAPLAEGRGAGDTVRYRAIATPASGRTVATVWRTAIVAEASTIREEAAAERAHALRGVGRAAAEAREAAEKGVGEEAVGADRRLRDAGTALAAALEQMLADPVLAAETRERLETYRRLLEGAVRAPFARRDAAYDPAAAARARSDLLGEIAAAVARAEQELGRAAAADTLARLAGVERALAAETRRTEPGRTVEAIGPRQQALARSARVAAERFPRAAAERLDGALERVAREIAGEDPRGAAEAQEEAAGAMSRAVGEAQAATTADTERRAARRAAVDRAAGEVLFLAERQRAVAERLGAPPAGADEKAEEMARQRVVTQGFERMLTTLVEGFGGIPARGETGQLLAEALYATRTAEGALARATGAGAQGEGLARTVAERAAVSLALLARSFLLPEDAFALAGAQGSSGRSGALARQLDALAAAQRAIADAAARSDDPAGGNPEAAAAERELGRELGGLGRSLEEQGVDPRAAEALVEAVEGAARRLERGLPGARTETELRSLARRFADLGRIVERREGERRAEAARAFVPAEPPPLPARVTGRRLDPEAALAPWAAELPRPAVEPARRYLERLAAEGVRAPGSGP